jgi:hypothetical protein
VSWQNAITQRLTQALWRLELVLLPTQWSMQALRVAAQSERASPDPQNTVVAKISVQAAARRSLRMSQLKHAR